MQCHLKSNLLKARSQLGVFWVGIGCQRGTPKTVIEQAIRQVFQKNHLAECAIAGIATINTKAEEAGLIEVCLDRNLPLLFYTADVLRAVTVPNPSSAIESAVDTPSVAEAAALLASWEVEKTTTRRYRDFAQGMLPTPHTVRLSAVRLSAHVEALEALHPTSQLCVPKQRFRTDGQATGVTIAIARSA